MNIIEGRLSIAITKKGKRELKAVYNSKGKEISMALDTKARAFNEDDAHHDDIIHIILDSNGRPEKVTIVGKEEVVPVEQIRQTAEHDKAKQYGNSQNRHSQNSASPSAQQAQLINATAPYNFIPQDRVLWIQEEDTPSVRYSGTLTCSLTTLRPLLVSGADTVQKENTPAEKHFFTVDGCLTVPGSTIKGMLRNLVEILSCSALQPVNNRALFWRNIDDKTYYMPKMTDQKAGFLIRRGTDYYIEPVHYKKVLSTMPKKTDLLRVYTGNIPKKKHDYDFEKTSNASSIPVPHTVIDNFLHQLTTEQKKHIKEQKHYISSEGDTDGIDLEQKLRDKDRLPIFYTNTVNGDIDFMGTARFFRYPTKYTVQDLRNIMHAMTNKETRKDFAGRLFGFATTKDSRSGRITVQCAVFPKDTKKQSIGPMVLGQPHATCVAHYMVQNPNTVKTLKSNSSRLDINTMANYNTGKTLRGRKMYWHRDIDYVSPPNDNKKVACTLHPVSTDVKAHFTVHLHNVRQEEVGAIVEALTLPEGHAHKLGMGKAAGLGSVRIDMEQCHIYPVKDFYADLQGRCQQFFTHAPKAHCLDTIALQKAKDAFRLWVLQGFGKTNSTADDFETLEHIRHLRHMMNFDKQPQKEKTQTMGLKEFQSLRILPSAINIR